LVPYASSSNNIFSEIPGSELPVAPYPLLPNSGTISDQTMMADMQVFVACFSIPHIIAAAHDVAFQMMVVANTPQRTMGQFIDLVDGTGWKLGSIGRSSKSAIALLVFNPMSI
jgi:hypothetical protein